MSLRNSTLPPHWDLSPEFQDILMRNGLQAHIIESAGTLKLMVKGHDSPFLSYDITPEQMRALTDWGTNSANKKAYNTLAGLIGNDFHLPRSYVHAQHANCRVAMGLHGYRLSREEAISYGIRSHRHILPVFGRTMLGWTPRNQPGYHLARPNGALFLGGGVMVPERINGHMKPGELQSGAYGFYYKGQPNSVRTAAPTREEIDILSELETAIKPEEHPIRKNEEAKPYKELITSSVYFSNEKFQECLASHGIVFSAESKKLTIQSEGATHDFCYDLTDEEAQILSDNSLKNVSIQDRLNVINNIIKDDFADPITMDMLNSNKVISIKLHPDVEQDLIVKEQASLKIEEKVTEKHRDDVQETVSMDGKALQYLNSNKAWYREVEHGREVQVDDIVAEKMRDGKYRMTAIIDGKTVSHEITEKQYNKFAAIDDYHRLKMVSKIFDEVDMKTIPGRGFNLLAAITAGLTVAGQVAGAVSHTRHNPEIYESHISGPAPRMLYKPGVDTPESIAARAFDMGRNSAEIEHHRGR